MTDFSVPTLSDSRKRYRDAFRSDIEGADSLLPASNLRVAGDVFGEMDFEFGQYQKAMADELMVDSAQAWLERHGAARGVYRKAATYAAGTLTVKGASGAILEDGTEAQAADGTLIVVDGGVTFTGPTATVSVTAKEAGAAGNLAAAIKVTFTKAIVGIEAVATVDEPGLSGGDDLEDLEDYRARVLEYMREPPQGGDESDYKKWAKEVAGVTRAWVSRKEMGAGTVTIRFMMDNVRSGFGGLPQGDDASDLAAGSGDQQTVLEYIQARRPVTADVFVCAPIADPVDIEISGLSTDTPAVRAAIEASLADAIRRDSEPGGTTRQSRLDEAISLATGEEYHTLVTPAANVTHATGHIAVLGTVTYV